jgi:uncharacterized protein involved in cysteine biosynthesis
MIDLKRLYFGFSAPWRGLIYLFKNRDLWVLALIPFVISALFYFTLIYLVFANLFKIVDSFYTLSSGPLNFILYWSLVLLTSIFSLVSLGIVSVFLTKIFAVPFNLFLAEKVLLKQGALNRESFHFARFLKDNFRLTLISFAKALVLLFVAILLFVLALIPGVQIGAILTGLSIAAFDVIDYSLEAYKVGLRNRFRLFQRHSLEHVGFGLNLGLFFLIPGLNIIFMPASVTGAALLVASWKLENDPEFSTNEARLDRNVQN